MLRVFKGFCAHSGLIVAVVARLAVMLEKILTSQQKVRLALVARFAVMLGFFLTSQYFFLLD